MGNKCHKPEAIVMKEDFGLHMNVQSLSLLSA